MKGWLPNAHRTETLAASLEDNSFYDDVTTLIWCVIIAYRTQLFCCSLSFVNHDIVQQSTPAPYSHGKQTRLTVTEEMFRSVAYYCTSVLLFRIS